MTHRREILDSEDDGDDFGSINGETDVPAQVAPVSHSRPVDLDLAIGDSGGETIAPAAETNDHSTGSTDPSFFQRIYEEQQAALSTTQDIGVDPTHAATSHSSGAITSPGRRPQKQSQSNAKSSSTTVTDPVPASKRTRKSRQSSMKEVVDLTQITTPRKGGASGEVDPWALPSSPLPGTIGSATRSRTRVTRSSEKRQNSTSHDNHLPGETGDMSPPSRRSSDPYDFPDTGDMSPVRPLKRKKRKSKSSQAQQRRSSEIIQQPEDTSGSGVQGRPHQEPANDNHLDSSIPPTMPTMFIAPTSLTASQKQQYMTVSLSSQQEVPEPQAGIKSSGVTTIAYPTPSRFASSAQRGITDDMLPYPVPNRNPDSPAPQDPMSSPDELAGSTRSRRTRSQMVPGGGASPQLESPVLTRSARRRTRPVDLSHQSSLQDPIVLDNTQISNEVLHEDISEPVGEDAEVPESADYNEVRIDADPVIKEPHFEDVVKDNTPVIQESTTKKKRGRKKKEQPIEEPVFEEPGEDPASTVDLTTADTEEPPAKRRRGRPRKSETAKPSDTMEVIAPADVIDDEFTLEPEAPVSLEEQEDGKGKGNKKNSRKSKKQPADDNVEPQQPNRVPTAEPEPEPQPLSEISHNSRQTPDDGAEINENIQRETPAVTAGKEETRAAANKAIPTPKTSGKVQYRVGLSKRSRIAPLLKSLKK